MLLLPTSSHSGIYWRSWPAPLRPVTFLKHLAFKLLTFQLFFFKSLSYITFFFTFTLYFIIPFPFYAITSLILFFLNRSTSSFTLFFSSTPLFIISRHRFTGIPPVLHLHSLPLHFSLLPPLPIALLRSFPLYYFFKSLLFSFTFFFTFTHLFITSPHRFTALAFFVLFFYITLLLHLSSHLPLLLSSIALLRSLPFSYFLLNRSLHLSFSLPSHFSLFICSCFVSPLRALVL